MRLLALIVLLAGPAASAQITLAHLITGHVRSTARIPAGWTETVEGTITLRRDRTFEFSYVYVLERAELTWTASGSPGNGCTVSGHAQIVVTDPTMGGMAVFRPELGQGNQYSVFGELYERSEGHVEQLHVTCPHPYPSHDVDRYLEGYLEVPLGEFEYTEIGLTDFRWVFAGSRGTGALDDPESVWRFESEPLPATPDEAGPDAGGLRLGGPNPVRDALHVDLTLDAPAAVRAEAFDALGRRVGVLHDGPLGAGTHVLTLGLPAGVYVVRATVGDRTLRRTVTLAR